MRTVKEISKEIMEHLIGDNGPYDVVNMLCDLEQNKEYYPDLCKEYELALENENLTHEEYCASLMRKETDIELKLSDARKLILEAIKISEKNNIVFQFGIPGGVSDTFNPMDGGWKHSAIC